MDIIKRERFLLLILLFFCAFLFFYNLGSYRLIDVDEPRYAEAAREMIESSNWITPYFNYQVRFDKPVFFYWLIALSYLVFGVTEFAARFPSAVLSTLLVFFTYFFGRQTISKSFGFISAMILATSLEVIGLGRMSITDMTLAFFICATLFSGFLGSYYLSKEKSENVQKKFSRSALWWWLAYLFSGIAVLTKGPVGFVLPAIIFGVYFLLTGTLKDNLKPKFVIPGFIIFLITVIPWYYAIIKVHGMAFVEYFFFKHNFSRFASEGFKQHQGPFYYYIPVILIGSFPWTVYLISALGKHFKSLYNYFIEKKNSLSLKNIALFKDADTRLQVTLYISCWFLIVFLFFSSSIAKLVTYVLPLFPAAAFLTGLLWEDYIKDNKNLKSIKFSTWITVAICLIFAVASIFSINFVLPRDEKLVMTGNIADHSIVLILLLVSISIFMFISLKKSQKFALLMTSCFLMAGIVAVAVNNVMPVVYSSGQKDLIKYIHISKKIKESKLLTYRLKKPSIVFYSKHRVPYIEGINELSRVLSIKSPVFVVVRKSQLDEISRHVRYNLIHNGIRYSLISNIKLQDMKVRE